MVVSVWVEGWWRVEGGGLVLGPTVGVFFFYVFISFYFQKLWK
jgi:hypothetical protein